MSELPGWIMEIVNNSLSEKKPVSVSRNSFLEKVLGESEMQKLNGWSKQTFFLGTTDDEKPEAPRKSWKALLQDENLTVWNTGGGIYVEKKLPNGIKMLTRRLTKTEVKEIENKWPEVGFPSD